MRKELIISVIVLLFISLACKKITKIPDSEKPFMLYVLDNTTGELVSNPFDEVHGIGRPSLEDISNSLGILLPLDIASDSSRFYFKKGNRIDTLRIFYKTSIGVGAKQFEVTYFSQKTKTSFKLLTQKCISQYADVCDDNQAFLIWGKNKKVTLNIQEGVDLTQINDTIDYVTNMNGERLNITRNANNDAFELPLDVQTDSAGFIFYTKELPKPDTLVVYYNYYISLGNKSFVLGLTLKKDLILENKKTTFTNLDIDPANYIFTVTK